MSDGFRAVIEDPEFIEQSEELLGPYGLFIGDEIEAAMRPLREATPEDFEWLFTFLSEEHQIEVDVIE